MKYIYTPKSISRKSMKVLYIRYTFALLFAVFILGGIAVFSLFIALALFFVFVIIYLFLILFYRKLYYKKFKYYVYKGKLHFKKGVFVFKESSIITENIQLIEFLTSPVQKWLGLCTIIFTFAGGKIRIPNIDTEESLKIADKVRGGRLNGL